MVATSLMRERRSASCGCTKAMETSHAAASAIHHQKARFALAVASAWAMRSVIFRSMSESSLHRSAPSNARTLLPSPASICLTCSALPSPTLSCPSLCHVLASPPAQASEHQEFFDKAHQRILPVRGVVDDALARQLQFKIGHGRG